MVGLKRMRENLDLTIQSRRDAFNRRDLLSTYPASNTNGSDPLPFVIPSESL